MRGRGKEKAVTEKVIGMERSYDYDTMVRNASRKAIETFRAPAYGKYAKKLMVDDFDGIDEDMMPIIRDWLECSECGCVVNRLTKRCKRCGAIFE